MYLHIGKDLIINNNDIIGIFNIDYIKNTKEYKSMYKSLEDNNNIFRVADVQPKTFILVEKNKNVKGYLKNIGSTTIGKRKM